MCFHIRLARNGHEVTIFNVLTDSESMKLSLDKRVKTISINYQSPKESMIYFSNYMWRYDFHAPQMLFPSYFFSEITKELPLNYSKQVCKLVNFYKNLFNLHIY